MKKVIIFVIGIFISLATYSQCNDQKNEKIGQYWTKEVVTGCTSTPNKLKINVTKCLTSKSVIQVWTKSSWEGKYSTMDYTVELLIEDNGTTVTVYFLDYTDNWYKSLVHTCIDLQNTKPLKISENQTQYFPYKEFEHKDVNCENGN